MKENLSAWMDSELSGEQARPLLPQLKRDAELRANWDCYHLIGDALRGVQGPDMCSKICARLDAEPTVLAPQRRSGVEKLGWFASVAAAARWRVAARDCRSYLTIPSAFSVSCTAGRAPTLAMKALMFGHLPRSIL
jgi:negative regulator of sigma E activity